MSEREKLALLEDMLELEEGSLTAEVELKDISSYDSMAWLSLIVLFEDEIGKKLEGKDIERFRTVGDILAAMES